MTKQDIEIIHALTKRYATKRYNSSKKISVENLTILKESIRLAPSSVGLQAFKVLHIENKDIRQLMLPFSFNQSQITDASDLFLFCIPKNVTIDLVDDLIQEAARTRNIELSSLNGFKNMILNTISSKNEHEKKAWLEKQVYIALGFLLQSAALLGIDSTPMEGFKTKEVDQLLALEEQNLQSVVICAIGYSAEDDKYKTLKKVRRKHDFLFQKIE